MSPEPTGVLIVRAWWENGDFRARIIMTTDIMSSSRSRYEALAADPADVRSHVDRWLEDFTGSGQNNDLPGGRSR